MRLATLRDGTRDGRLVVVAPDGEHVVAATGVAATLQAALDDWDGCEAPLRRIADELSTGRPSGAVRVAVGDFAAPLPRAWQWLDGSVYPEHGRLMQQAFGLPPIDSDRPLMYQGMSDRFLGPLDDVPLPSEADGIDFEGELGVITGTVPMGAGVRDAAAKIHLLVQINDWSLRTIAPIEMKTGFGWVQAKPACSMAPFAVTPDEFGGNWRDGRLAATLEIDLDGQRFGAVDGAEEMAFGFDELVAHAARTRELCAGTVIGSGTLSTSRHAEVGSSCISERRAIDAISGQSPMPFMRFGSRVRMRALVDGRDAFGTIDQRVVPLAG